MAGSYLLTTVVGSYPQPEWLIDRQALAGITSTTALHLCFGYAAVVQENPVSTPS